ncbi:MAG: acyl-CoA dehydrogenase family protein [Desulfobacterales bacterium]|nr:acyl-CoA dehydrogenase family protein [Desulfobacterales bacterium]
MLSFGMSKEQKMIKDEVAKLVKGVVTDNAKEMDGSGKIPAESIQKAWGLGASISGIPEEYGGYGMKDSPIETSIILEELAYGDMAFTIAITAPSLFIGPVNAMGTEAQKKKYLPLYCKDTYTPCSFAINEPHFGFDAVELKTTATKKNGSYILNGIKCFVPLAKQASHMLIAASFEGKNNLFIVSGDNPGLEISEREANLGLYSLETYEVALKNCEIPAEDRLGGEDGCDYDKMLQKTRIAMSALGTGISRASYEFARDYAKERVQWGEPIVYRQSIAFMIAEMAYETDAMRFMTWQAASRLESTGDAKRESYLAKFYAGEMTMKITDYGVQILGGHGYVRDYPVERYYRNSRGISILEGMATV